MKKARVLLVAPNLLVNEGELNRIEPPLGLMLFAQTLLDNGHKVKIHDYALEGWDIKKLIDPVNKRYLRGQTDKYIANSISNFSPDVVAISVLYSSLIDSAKDVARIVKKVNKKAYRTGMKSILSELVRQDRLSIVEEFKVKAPKTKDFIAKIKSFIEI